jgi:hypothetical protein
MPVTRLRVFWAKVAGAQAFPMHLAMETVVLNAFSRPSLYRFRQRYFVHRWSEFTDGVTLDQRVVSPQIGDINNQWAVLRLLHLTESDNVAPWRAGNKKWWLLMMSMPAPPYADSKSRLR